MRENTALTSSLDDINKIPVAVLAEMIAVASEAIDNGVPWWNVSETSDPEWAAELYTHSSTVCPELDVPERLMHLPFVMVFAAPV